MTEGKQTRVLADVGEFRPLTIPLRVSDPPLSGEVHLWFLDLGTLAGSLRNALGGAPQAPSPLTPGQLRFARRFYLRLLLGAYLGIPGKAVVINRKLRGKPVLDSSAHDSKLHFSMAKSEDKILVGFSTSSHIGVDLEAARRRARNSLGVAKRYFSQAEAAALEQAAPGDLDQAFLRLWACKEAVVKASGKGIANQFGRFTVEADLFRPARMLDFEGGGPGDWSLALVQPEDDFLGALAVRDGMTDLKAFRLLPASH